MTEQRQGRQDRRLKNYLVAPRVQVTYSMFLAGVMVLFVAIVLLVLYQHLQMVTEVTQDAELANEVFRSIGVVLAPITIILVLVTVVSAILFAHRIIGPKVPILRFVKGLTTGDLQSRLRLRQGDVMQDLADALNELADQLAADSEDLDATADPQPNES